MHQLELKFQIIMSWQDYIDTQLIGKDLKRAVIAGHDGNVWAKSPDFNVTPSELQTLLTNYGNQESLASAGFSLGGQKYFYLRLVSYLQSLLDEKYFFSAATTRSFVASRAREASTVSRPTRLCSWVSTTHLWSLHKPQLSPRSSENTSREWGIEDSIGDRNNLSYSCI